VRSLAPVEVPVNESSAFSSMFIIDNPFPGESPESQVAKEIRESPTESAESRDLLFYTNLYI
jgi:hypothetical protein